MPSKKLTILIPVYNDFESLNLLIPKIESHYPKKQLSFIIVNDNSHEEKFNLFTPPASCNIKIINLIKNMGHQRAIVIGLAYVAKHISTDYIVVMDADGEDKPEHIQKLIDTAEKQKSKIIFAKRSKRNEGIIYKILYCIYKLFFKFFTGKTINFGNFSIIPYAKLNNLVHVSEIWIHFSGGIINSKLSYDSIPLEKGERLSGISKMNLTSLIIHGLSAIAVHVETLIVRLLIFSLSLIGLSFLGIIIIFLIRVFSDLAIPGWATSSILELCTILVQAFFMSLLFVFFILNRRSQKNLIPALEYENYIMDIQDLNEKTIHRK